MADNGVDSLCLFSHCSSRIAYDILTDETLKFSHILLLLPYTFYSYRTNIQRDQFFIIEFQYKTA